ncbi:hypothetical protein ACN38_g4219 [Penicillium nordicum]|uniref:Uncharacterized protein n=1 Tax=Penicillium nordicum TaxID=229535 RepID=A0A0M9WHB6_9EURO|nr:hypothetical protein ACN38_g4219 [Penicillium nordicum]
MTEEISSRNMLGIRNCKAERYRGFEVILFAIRDFCRTSDETAVLSESYQGYCGYQSYTSVAPGIIIADLSGPGSIQGCRSSALVVMRPKGRLLL